MSRKMLFTVVLVSSGLTLVTSSSFAAGKKAVAKPDPVAAAVETVLREETAGPVNRRQRLTESLASHPDSAVARWQAGFVRDGQVWRSFDDPQPVQRDDEALERYLLRREVTARTVADQMSLADWCRKRNLPDQERAHLTAALLLAPTEEQSAIFPRLGYCKVGNQWVSGEQFAEWQESNRRTTLAVQTWGPKLEKIAEKLGGSRRQRAQGLASLEELASTDSLPAIEYVLCGRDEPSALAALDAFEKVKGYQGTLALARQAVFSKWTSVMERATALVKSRRLDEFVPEVIALLASPVTATYSAAQLYYFQDRPGDTSPCGFVLIWNYILARETDDQFQVAVLNAADYRLNYFMRGAILNSLDLIGLQTGYWMNNKGLYTGVPVNPLSFRADRYSIDSILQDGLDLAQANRSDAEQAYQREKELDAINERTDELNRRVIALLAGVTGREPSPDPAAWWTWWAEHSDLQQTGGKPVVTVVDEKEILGDPTLRFNRVSGRCCCLVAGTPIWTDQGLVAIEKIMVGDRVLSQDVETGGLAYKPVLHTTVRPPADLTTLHLGSEKIVCTSAHRFWNSGTGWIKSRDLQAPTLLHTVTGNEPVRSAKKTEAAQTYNLVVADFHTYFVGKTGVLSQDLLSPKSTNRVVPGQSPSSGSHH
jgi:hypothetical protein